ncbi:unnamed protein product [Prorocentrum cordatum]|uniref:Spondin-like TSP1 domain-containing protein n=1 Tax=Prorocentrum cordatum TaxID=2364126 RepID=A0ABN9QFG2_9DINO|nr:unnamed protein product [Polarella glacialis]
MWGSRPGGPRPRQWGQGLVKRCSQEVAACDAAGEKPRACVLTPWAEWSSCSATCEGQRFRRREIAEGEPADCFLEAADTVETEPCGASSCGAGVDCELSEWTEWGNCSQACGVGVAQRSREVKSPGREGGLGCAGGLEEVKACMAAECLAVDCQWAQWDDWAACTRTCGGGNHRRTRTVLTTQENGGAPCAAEDKAEVAPCATQSCEVCIDGAWSSWEDWSECSASCGGGLRARHREVAQRPNSCGKPAVGLEDEYDVCSTSPCEAKKDCELSEWTEWSSCSSDCFGVRERSRHVVQYASGGGEACQNESLKVVSPCRPGPDEDAPAECGEQPPRPCRMASWEDWGACSASCDGGQKRRQRIIESPSHNGGAPCNASTSEEAPCGTEPCDAESGNDCRWGSWSEWSSCAQCGGQRNRHRAIARPAKAGGIPCDAGSSQEVEPCESACEQSYYCTWSEWSGLGGCSAECGHASQMRQRQLVFTKEKPSHGNILFEGSYDLSCAGSQINVSACPYVDCAPKCEPQDCVFSDWNEWTEPTCLQLCERHRVIQKMDSCGGRPCNGSLLETKNCGKTCDQKEDCVMSSWSAWVPPRCSKTGQQRFRTREILQAPSELGKPCVGSINETVSCIVPPPAAVDCKLSEWVSWSECTRTCDGGLRRRARSIENASQSGGLPCKGPLEQLEPCATEPCIHSARPCELGAWSEWSRCDGNQMQSRQRKVEQEADDSGTQCAGPTKETQPCSAVVDCVVSDWTAWDECDATCGGGQQARQRAVVQAQSHGGARCAVHLGEMRGCNSDPCGDSSAEVGSWSDWGVCDADCGAGSMERQRTVNFDPVKGGSFSGELSQAVGCLGEASNSSDCAQPVDCQWGDWDDWTECSLPCDGGQRERKRKIAQAPRLGGRLCDAQNKEEIEPCNLERCDNGECVDGKWSDWQDWTPCSATCDGGVSFRSRLVAREASHCGRPATGASTEHKACNAGVVCTPAQDCQFADWSEWTDCTAACAGVKRRSRGFAQQGQGGGKSCDGALQQTGPCTRPGADCGKEQAVDCQVGDWESWGACDVTCGAGQKARSRDILQEASGGGASCQDDMIETARCQAAPCKSACNATDCRWGDWDDWSACEKCGGQKRRSRAIEQHAACGGRSCDPGATEQIEECPRKCHGATFCAWGDWSNFTECSATCGSAVKSRQRKLERRDGGLAPEARAGAEGDGAHEPAALDLQVKYDQLHRRAEALAESRRRQLAVAWGAGMLGLVALMAASAALRTRARSSEGYRGLPVGRALLHERSDGYTVAPQMSPPSSPMIAHRLPGLWR